MAYKKTKNALIAMGHTDQGKRYFQRTIEYKGYDITRFKDPDLNKGKPYFAIYPNHGTKSNGKRYPTLTDAKKAVDKAVDTAHSKMKRVPSTKKVPRRVRTRRK